MATEIVTTWEIPDDAIWCIGQDYQDTKWRRMMDKECRAGKYKKVRASWMMISPLKTVYVPLPGLQFA